MTAARLTPKGGNNMSGGNGGFGFLDPPARPPSGYSGDAPRVSELVGRVIAAIGPEEDHITSAKYGELDVVRCRVVVVFDRDGTPRPYRNFLFYQYRLRLAIIGRPATLGRISRPGPAFELEPVADKLRIRAGEALVEGGWINPDGSLPEDPKPMRGETFGRRWDEYDDGEAF